MERRACSEIRHICLIINTPERMRMIVEHMEYVYVDNTPYNASKLVITYTNCPSINDATSFRVEITNDIFAIIL